MSEKMSNQLERVENGHIDQCQSIRPNIGKQCNFKVVEGSRHCLLHGGHSVIAANTKASLNQYRLGKYQKRMSEFAESEKLRTIDEEIGILRMVLEEVFKQCSSDVDLLLYSQKISDLIKDITKCVQVADKLATKAGMLIGRAEAMIIANRVVEILPKYIHNEEELLSIAEEISDAFLTKVEGSDGSAFGMLEKQ